MGIAMAIVFCRHTIVNGSEKGFSCIEELEQYKICSNCYPASADLRFLNKACPTSEEVETPPCTCDYIKTADMNERHSYIGGPDCQSKDQNNEAWCYVLESSNCEDKQFSWDALAIDGLWSSNLHYSKAACQNSTYAADVGNEEFKPGFKILSEPMKTIDIEEPELCIAECWKTNKCGAWTFKTETNECHLFGVAECCGQTLKQSEDPTAASGYRCSCWTTHSTTCPCSEEAREELFFSKHSAGGQPLTTMTTSAVISTLKSANIWKIKCTWRLTRRGWRCLNRKALRRYNSIRGGKGGEQQ